MDTADIKRLLSVLDEKHPHTPMAMHSKMCAILFLQTELVKAEVLTRVKYSQYWVQKQSVFGQFEDSMSYANLSQVEAAFPYYRKDTARPLRVILRTTDVVFVSTSPTELFKAGGSSETLPKDPC